MHKSPLRLNLKRDSTKSYILNEVNGTYSLGGHVGHFFDEFAKIHNATITFPCGYSDALIFDDLLDNNTIDMSQQLSYNIDISDRVFSDSYEFFDWCIMVPIEKRIPNYMYYAKLFNFDILWLILTTVVLLTSSIALSLWLDGNTMRIWESLLYIYNGVLGQPYQMINNPSRVRCALYMLTCLGGIILNTTYSSYLQSFHASPPKEKAINTLNDVLANRRKILMYKDEYEIMVKYLAQSNKIYAKVIKTVPTFSEFYKLRDSYDTRYLYTVPSVQWRQYDEQQKFFAKRKFRLSDICFMKMSPLMITMQANSPFEEPVNEMIGLLRQAGLLRHWQWMAFLEAIQRKRISLLDHSEKNIFEPMKFEDTIWFMCLYLILCGVCVLSFLLEILWSRRHDNLVDGG
ncbi:uncharacterized protein LOC133324425 [Musca vetustissima]|uniref:uncharacterized protein LOC133324425 n=1 Tax=Musca vetustissima TaxID=27455 RepID=UPI002AB694AD|nr:uncharacterized protein LOC133324425 [Musca vetustissima]